MAETKEETVAEVDSMVNQDLLNHIDKIGKIIPQGWEFYGFKGQRNGVLENKKLGVKREFMYLLEVTVEEVRDIVKPYMKDLPAGNIKGKGAKKEVEIPFADEVPKMTTQSGGLSPAGVNQLIVGSIQATQAQLAGARGTVGIDGMKILDHYLKVRTMFVLEDIRELLTKGK